MNRHLELHQSRITERYPLTPDKVKVAAALAAVSALLLTGSTSSSQFDGSRQTPSVMEVVQYGEPIPANFFEDITILSIDNPDDDITPTLDAEYLSDSFGQAITGISDTLNGSIDIPSNIPVLPISVRATTQYDSEKSEYECLDEDTVYAAREVALAQQNKPVDTLTPMIIQSDEKICQIPENAAAYVKRDGISNGGVFYKTVFDSNDHDGVVRVLQHEQGHTIGLGHSSALVPKGPRMPMGQEGGRDVIDLLKSGNYGLAGHYASDGSLNVNEYSGTGTVMGGITGIPDGGDVYNFVEINRLSPNASQIRLIDVAQPNTYVVNTDPGAVRGIAFDIPPEHPLRALFKDDQITKLTVGLNSTNGDEMATLAVIGQRASGATTSLDTVSFIPKLDYETRLSGGVTVYQDSLLDIRVVANATRDALTRNNGEVELSIELLSSAG